MHIGLIGGIGPAATVAYYQRLCFEMQRRGAPLNLTIVHAQTREVVARFNADQRVEQAKDYGILIDRLKSAGCDCVAITSLGGHFCLQETLSLASLPIVSAIAPLDDHFAAKGLSTVGLLGTGLVMRSGLYGQLKRTRAVAPSGQGEIDRIGMLYQEMAVAGRCADAAREEIIEAGRRMIDDQAADAIVLAGTDLNLVFDGVDPGYPIIDALDVHVSVLADIATGMIDLKNVAASK
jgi:aspartate racemase